MRRNKVSINGEHSRVRSLDPLRAKGLGFRNRWIVKRKARERLPKSYSASMCLANLLYPNHFPRTVASGLDRKTTFSEHVEVSERSKRAIKLVYRRVGNNPLAFLMRGFDNLRPGAPPFRRHEKQVRLEAEPIRDAIRNESGIRANITPMNVGFRGRLPFFFEISSINLFKLRDKIVSLPEGRKKKQALRLFELIQADSSEDGIVRPHR